MDPREPLDIAKEIIENDQDTIEDLLKDTEVEDEEYEDSDFMDELPPIEDSSDSDVDYF